MKAVNVLGSSQCQAEFIVESDESSVSGLSESEDAYPMTTRSEGGDNSSGGGGKFTRFF